MRYLSNIFLYNSLGKKGGGDVSDLDSDFVALSSGSDEHYDSDKDPSWDPSENPVSCFTLFVFFNDYLFRVLIFSWING